MRPVGTVRCVSIEIHVYRIHAVGKLTYDICMCYTRTMGIPHSTSRGIHFRLVPRLKGSKSGQNVHFSIFESGEHIPDACSASGPPWIGFRTDMVFLCAETENPSEKDVVGDRGVFPKHGHYPQKVATADWAVTSENDRKMVVGGG